MSKRVYIRDYKKHGNQYCYVLDNICSGDLPDDATDKQKIRFVMNDFKSSPYYSNSDPIRNMSHWLKYAYPRTNFVGDSNNIIALGQSWGYCQTKAKQRKFVQKYWKYLAIRVFQIYDYFYKNN